MYISAMFRGLILATLMSAVLAAQTAPPGAAYPASKTEAKPATKVPATPTQEAAAMIADGKADEGLQLIEKILAQKPGDREATLVKMDALIALERTPEAVSVYDAYIIAGGKHDVPMARYLARSELRHLASGDRPAVKDTAAELLKKGGEPVPPPSTVASVSPAPPAPVLPPTARSGPPAKPAKPQTPEEILASTTSSPEARMGALLDLKAPATAKTPELVRNALADPAPRVKMMAIDTVGRLDLRALIPDLRPLLSDDVLLVKLKAAAALRQLGDHAGDEILQATLKADFLAGRLIAARALRASGDTTSWVPAITQLLDSPRANERVLAAELLLDTNKSAQALEIVRANLKAQDPPVRADAVRILAQQANASPWDFLPLLRDPNPAVRVQAAGVIVRALPATAAAAAPQPARQPAAASAQTGRHVAGRK